MKFKEELLFEKQNWENNYKSIDNATVFISHAHVDRNFAYTLARRIESLFNMTCYLDWKDPNMPAETNVDTAVRLREKIQSCKKFLFLGTKKALDSNWCNWELGYADNLYGSHTKIGVLPIDVDTEEYKDYEFIELYTLIEFDYKNKKFKATKPKHAINNILLEAKLPGLALNDEITLEEWLKKT